VCLFWLSPYNCDTGAPAWCHHCFSIFLSIILSLSLSTYPSISYWFSSTLLVRFLSSLSVFFSILVHNNAIHFSFTFSWPPSQQTSPSFLPVSSNSSWLLLSLLLFVSSIPNTKSPIWSLSSLWIRQFLLVAHCFYFATFVLSPSVTHVNLLFYQLIFIRCPLLCSYP